MTSPDTVSEAVALLHDEGYVDDFELCSAGILDPTSGAVHPAGTAVVDYRFRFEGPSDPGDAAVVLGVRCPDWDRKGIVVSAFGPDADAEESAILIALADQPGSRRTAINPEPGPAQD